MLKGIEVDQCELEREMIRRHKHFVTALKKGQMFSKATSGSNSVRNNIESTRSSSGRKKPPVGPSARSGSNQRPRDSSQGYRSMYERKQEIEDKIME